MNQKNIYVTEPYLPDISEFIPYLEEIWKTKKLTNSGPFHQLLEERLADYLGVKHISLFANATIALITALQALDVKGDVITTPYSFVASSHSILWNNLNPIFVDLAENSFNIDPEKIEKAITPNTSAILAVHCYGFPCCTGRLQEIANKYGLKIIYDAAHAFGVKKNKTSILNCGDVSILSFHATKVFNTFEGGAIICDSPEMKKKIDLLKNFGFENEVSVVATGINGKMNELSAAMGLLQLTKIDENIKKRKNIYEKYLAKLQDSEIFEFYKYDEFVDWNYSYCPVLIREKSGIDRDFIYEELKKFNIYARRYFYPIISDFPMYRNNDTVMQDNFKLASNISKRIICLPLYPDLLESEHNFIIEKLKSFKV